MGTFQKNWKLFRFFFALPDIHHRVEVRPYFPGFVGPYNLGQLLHGAFPDGFDTPVVFQEHSGRFFTNPFYIFQLTDETGAATFVAVVGDGKAVRFVANLLNQFQRL
jgi:hypothetical protein